jgi:hypothetical protein
MVSKSQSKNRTRLDDKLFVVSNNVPEVLCLRSKIVHLVQDSAEKL